PLVRRSQGRRVLRHHLVEGHGGGVVVAAHHLGLGRAVLVAAELPQAQHHADGGEQQHGDQAQEGLAAQQDLTTGGGRPHPGTGELVPTSAAPVVPGRCPAAPPSTSVRSSTPKSTIITNRSAVAAARAKPRAVTAMETPRRRRGRSLRGPAGGEPPSPLSRWLSVHRPGLRTATGYRSTRRRGRAPLAGTSSEACSGAGPRPPTAVDDQSLHPAGTGPQEGPGLKSAGGIHPSCGGSGQFGGG